MTGLAGPIDWDGTAPVFTGQDQRQLNSVTMMPSGTDNLGQRSGMRAGAEPVLSLTTSTWTVAPFAGVGSLGSNAGDYWFKFDANETGSLTPADATNGRIDRLDVTFPAATPSGDLVAAIVYTAGTASSSPSIPAAPANSTPLFQINVPAVGNDPTGTSLFAYTVANGGILPVANSAGRPAVPFQGLATYRKDNDTVEVYTGSAWKTYAPVDHAVSIRSAVIAISAASTNVHIVAYDGGTTIIGDAITFAGGIYTVNKSGIYHWSGTAACPSGVTGGMRVLVEINGVGSQFGQASLWTGQQALEATGGSDLVLTAGDTVQFCLQITTTAMAGSYKPIMFSLHRVA